MHSIYQRLQSGFTLFIYANIALTITISLFSLSQLYFTDAVNSVKASTGNYHGRFKMIRMAGYSRPQQSSAEGCKLRFDLDYDISPLFNWNTKQVFLYATAEYPGTRPDINNEVTFWDKIITNRRDAAKSLKNVDGSYAFWDPSRKFSHQNATVKLKYNIQPYTGWLKYGEIPLQGENWFTLPESPQNRHESQ